MKVDITRLCSDSVVVEVGGVSVELYRDWLLYLLGAIDGARLNGDSECPSLVIEDDDEDDESDSEWEEMGSL